MFINLVLTIVYGIFVLKTSIDALAPTLPMACVWQHHATFKQPQSNKVLSVVGTAVVIAATCVIFVLGTWYLHMRRQRWGKIVRVLSLVVLAAMAVGAAVRVIMVSQAFGTPSVDLQDQAEKQWSFGQLLTMLLLILPFISALEILRGEMRVPQSNQHLDGDQQPLTGNEELKPVGDARFTYQPNPLFR